MWVSKKKWNNLEKRVADLEEFIQDQLVPTNLDSDKISESIKDFIAHYHEATRDTVPKSS